MANHLNLNLELTNTLDPIATVSSLSQPEPGAELQHRLRGLQRRLLFLGMRSHTRPSSRPESPTPYKNGEPQTGASVCHSTRTDHQRYCVRRIR